MNHGPIALNQSTSSVSSLNSLKETQSSNDLHSDSMANGDNNVIDRPHLPWMNRNNFLFASSINSDIHIMKRRVPEGSPRIPVKKWRRWTWYKIWLILMNTLLFVYGLITLILGLCTYFKRKSSVALRQSTQAHSYLVVYQRALVFLIGEATIVNWFTAIILNNRPLLAVYNLLMWPCLGMIAAIGYTAYRKSKWNIEGKLSYQWHYQLDSLGRANIQANLHCCGYKTFADYHERSNKCYPRTLYPGCKYKYQNLTMDSLRITWTVAFSMIPVHLLVLFSALMCSNHVNDKFGKGLPPKLYHIDYKEIMAVTPSVSSVSLVLHRDETDLHRRHT
ncbi:conserved hypothetical protein [Mucor ambiguus]|uniref:Tetraspanin Tsp2 family n=1 Tax=Mucor ambiguus TaxID=91626 RepID=A0A0C9MJ96_9FUNG|nr:conserved hypothetical protein [Mucor ambiguus]